MANRTVHLPVANGFGATLRKDNWWVGPAITFVILSAFIVYATYRAFENKYYAFEHYLSPFYSPLFETKSLGIKFFTPAMLILPFPGAFRFTCYYYRKAYYRSFAMSPPACAVGGRATNTYNGERKLLLFQNLHRYAMYFALLFLVFLWHDFYDGLWFDGPNGKHLGFGGGTLMLLLNCSFLSLYTFSCHSFRHMIGGGIDSYSEAPFGRLRHKIWSWVSKININHMAFAWISLFGVALTDLYIRSVASGAIQDFRLF